MEGFNCLSEKLCVPQERVCDGYPDCVRDTTIFDEINCTLAPGTRYSFIKAQMNQSANPPLILYESMHVAEV